MGMRHIVGVRAVLRARGPPRQVPGGGRGGAWSLHIRSCMTIAARPHGGDSDETLALENVEAVCAGACPRGRRRRRLRPV